MESDGVRESMRFGGTAMKNEEAGRKRDGVIAPPQTHGRIPEQASALFPPNEDPTGYSPYLSQPCPTG